MNREFNFSIEELYYMYGRYDRYVSIEFHRDSMSAMKFGGVIDGTIFYLKKERDSLEAILNSKEIPRTKGMVRFEANIPEELTVSLRRELKEIGFPSEDIYSVSPIGYSTEINAFRQSGIKRIDDTIEVKVNSKNLNKNKIIYNLYNHRIKDGYPLIEEERAEYFGLLLYFNSKLEIDDIIKLCPLMDNIQIKETIRFYELEAKRSDCKISETEKIEFRDILLRRSKKRMEMTKREIKCSTNKSIEDFKFEYTKIYRQLLDSIILFKDESLYYANMITPIYWTYEKFLHIYLRHSIDYDIEGGFASKTKFQYIERDIKEVLKMAISELSSQINDNMKHGKEFTNDKFYFNGNYYKIHISKDGLVNTFYPLNCPKE